jgi:hypothetical protein
LRNSVAPPAPATVIAIGIVCSAREESLRRVTTAAAPSELRTTVAPRTFTSVLSRVIDRPVFESDPLPARWAARSNLALFSAVVSQPPSASATSTSAAALNRTPR